MDFHCKGRSFFDARYQSNRPRFRDGRPGHASGIVPRVI